ncbi:MAG: YdjY domain-containing protein [Planctomycetota bacterium]
MFAQLVKSAGIAALVFLPTAAPRAQQQGEPPASKPAAQEPAPLDEKQKKELVEILAKGGVTIDFAAKTVSVEATVNTRDDYIEYILIGPRGKRHEGLFVTAAKPRLIHAAMIALGFKPGKNAEAIPKDPFPTEEEVEKGVDTHIRKPPEGQKLYLSVHWKDEDGKRVEYRVDDLYHDLVHGGSIQDAEWIYLGSRMAPLYKGEDPVFLADYDQNLISNYYVRPDNQLVTIRHPHAWDDSIWFPITDRLPPKGAPVTFVLSAEPKVKPKPLAPPKEGEARRQPNPGEPGQGGGGGGDQGGGGGGGDQGGGEGGGGR